MTFNQIMTKIDNARTLDEFDYWCEELSVNRRRYLLHQLFFAEEFIGERLTRFTKNKILIS
jgi:hypothetical protein